MIVLVDNKRPTGIGESLSGAKAFYISSEDIDDWQIVELHPDYQMLDVQDRLRVEAKFPESVERYKALWSTPFY